MTNQPTDEPGIPVYDEADERAARSALSHLQPLPFAPTIEQAVREIAGAVARARAEGRREALDELSTTLGTAEHALDELTGDVDLVRLVVEHLKASGVTSP